jgi:hypothetical protein
MALDLPHQEPGALAVVRLSRPKSIDASSSRTSSKGYRSWEMEQLGIRSDRHGER